MIPYTREQLKIRAWAESRNLEARKALEAPRIQLSAQEVLDSIQDTARRRSK